MYRLHCIKQASSDRVLIGQKVFHEQWWSATALGLFTNITTLYSCSNDHWLLLHHQSSSIWDHGTIRDIFSYNIWSKLQAVVREQREGQRPECSSTKLETIYGATCCQVRTPGTPNRHWLLMHTLRGTWWTLKKRSITWEAALLYGISAPLWLSHRQEAAAIQYSSTPSYFWKLTPPTSLNSISDLGWFGYSLCNLVWIKHFQKSCHIHHLYLQERKCCSASITCDSMKTYQIVHGACWTSLSFLRQWCAVPRRSYMTASLKSKETMYGEHGHSKALFSVIICYIEVEIDE